VLDNDPKAEKEKAPERSQPHGEAARTIKSAAGNRNRKKGPHLHQKRNRAKRRRGTITK